MLFQTDFLVVLGVGQNWLPNSPDLKIQKHFLGVFKGKIFLKYPQTLLELWKKQIVALFRAPPGT